MPTALTAVAAPGRSFESVVGRVLALSRPSALAQDSQRRAPESTRQESASERLGPAFDGLSLFLRSLDDETRAKLRVLVRAGREARALEAVAAATEQNYENQELFTEQELGSQHLQRGHALARATEFDLERELVRWGEASGRATLDERVWLRFGRELALSPIEDWSCFALIGPGERLEKLYLRSRRNGWWSFGSLIDRPSERSLAVLRSARSGRSRFVVLPLAAALGRAGRRDLKAVRRASRAMRARLGRGAARSAVAAKPDTR